MIETNDLILDKGKAEDFRNMYQYIYSDPMVSQYMFWQTCNNEQEGKERFVRMLTYQSNHPYCFTVYLKETGQAIGFAGFHISAEKQVSENGIAIGKKYWHLGYGKQILLALLELALKQLKMETFVFQCQKDNLASNCLAKSCGFELIKDKIVTNPKNGFETIINVYQKNLK